MSLLTNTSVDGNLFPLSRLGANEHGLITLPVREAKLRRPGTCKWRSNDSTFYERGVQQQAAENENDYLRLKDVKGKSYFLPVVAIPWPTGVSTGGAVKCIINLCYLCTYEDKRTRQIARLGSLMTPKCTHEVLSFSNRNHRCFSERRDERNGISFYAPLHSPVNYLRTLLGDTVSMADSPSACASTFKRNP